MRFNEAQKKAIEHGTGPMLVLAGPGSGKTAVITRRVLELTKRGVAPGNILVITFTKAAATEMQERFARLQKEEGGTGLSGRVNFGTFHAVFFKILKYAYQWDASNIIREEVSTQLLSDLVRKLDVEIEDEREFIDGIRSEISKIKSERIDIKTYYSMNCPEEQFQRIFFEYTEKMKQQRLIDFDDILLYTYELLSRRPEVLKLWQDKYQYILIDEFQDINRIQYDIIRMLAKPQDNLFIVGDDDQSIYGFRGAKPDIMLSFPETFKKTKKVVLDSNYRSSSQILGAADRLIGNNKKRFVKKTEAVAGDHENVHIVSCKDLQTQYGAIVDKILAYEKRGIDYKNMAVLVRTNLQARTLVGKLMEVNIPFYMKEHLPNIFDHFVVKDLLAYLELADGKRDRALFLRVANRPSRYISHDVFSEKTISFADIYSYYSEKPQMERIIDSFQNDILAIRDLPVFAAIDYIRTKIGYDGYVRDYAEYRGVSPEEYLQVLDDVQESASSFMTLDEWKQYMEEYKEELQNNKNEMAEENALQIMTMHGSKGLEFEVVFIPDCNEGVTPFRKANLPEEIEEERRMFYVAMTRAKKYLNLSYVKKRYNKEAKPSRFLLEISDKIKC